LLADISPIGKNQKINWEDKGERKGYVLSERRISGWDSIELDMPNFYWSSICMDGRREGKGRGGEGIHPASIDKFKFVFIQI
jgi:hypothetical protein